MPKYKNKDGRFTLVIDNIKSHIENDYIRFSWKPLRLLNNKFKTKTRGRLIQVRFIPRGSDYIMEVVYEVEVPEMKEKEVNNIIGIDLGVSNFATMGNNIGIKPIIINGKIAKSINQYYNKKKARLSSELKLKHDKRWSNHLQRLTTKRNNKMDDFIHKSSRYIINYCLQNNINIVIIGRNEEWKQKSNIGRQNNQNFTSIPHDLFIQKLQYKCEDCGIKFIITEENYTSKASFLDKDNMTKDTIFKGKRIKRGLYRSKDKTLINADLNAAYNIIRKVVPEFNYDGIEGVGLHPVRINTI